jgi:Family of unknown function (DUF5684)
MTDYDSSSYSNVDPAIIVFSLVFGLVLYAIFAFLLGKIFVKAGVESWKAWVPVYNQWAFLEIGGQKGWIVLLSLLSPIPLLGFIASLIVAVYSCIAAYNIGQGMGKDGLWVVLYIFLPVIWLAVFALDSSRYLGTYTPQR